MITMRRVNQGLLSAAMVLLAGAPGAGGEVDERDAGWARHLVLDGAYNTTAVAGDYTGDGLVDVITNSNGQTMLLAAPDYKRLVIDSEQPPRSCIHSATFDVNRDGRPDFIGADYSPGHLFWLECPAKTDAVPWNYHLIDRGIDGIHGVALGDLDRDQRTDLVANSAQPEGPFADSIVWYRVPKDATRPWERFVLADHDAPGLSHYLGVGDVNGDGRLDVASAAKGGPTARPGTGNWFAWWEAPADPRKPFRKHLIAAGQDGATNIQMGDVNGDGTTDFIATRGHGRGVVWFAGPAWRENVIHPMLASPHSLDTADLDGDGDLDAAACGYDDRKALWFENDGRGRFTCHVLSRDQAAYDLKLVDMDGDGDRDILIAGQQSKNVVWYENPAKPRD